ncbi:MAG: excinuclease subunit [Thermovirga sp.]|nr:excinuclease subunit [Thermovirga sp.]MDN5367894.1 excinuclease subunit [Thermovirga sp.]
MVKSLSREIIVKGAREHNLKNINLKLPKDSLIVITGPSGSGKSSLAFDTICAEGQRRYIESLSSYARQFLGVQDKPDVDDIEGLSPTISIEQKGISHNPRSTVGTVTEVYDYLRLLFARVGVPYCPKCGRELKRYTVDQILEYLYRNFWGQKVEILSPVVMGKKGEFKNLFVQLQKKGFLRVKVDGYVYWLEEEIVLEKNKKHDIEVLVDKLTVNDKNRSRLAESVESAIDVSKGFVQIENGDGYKVVLSDRFVCPSCEVSFPELEPRLFSFNSPFGACPDCEGLGSHQYFSVELAIDKDAPLLEGGILPWAKKNHYMLRKLKALFESMGESLEGKSFNDLREDLQRIVVYGSPVKVPMKFMERGESIDYMGRYDGLIPWLQTRWRETESESVRNELLNYRDEDICKSCNGSRLREEARSVKIHGYSIVDFVNMPVEDLLDLLQRLPLDGNQAYIGEPIIDEIKKRLSFMVDIGIGYLSLSRRSDTLSSGESQRIRLATQIGAKLSGVLYVLDEPTIGLHSRDTERLVRILKSIRDLGNTVLVVEHDRDTMKMADHIVEIGPGPGEHGGRIVAQGAPEEIMKGDSLSAGYLLGTTSGIVHSSRERKPSGWLSFSKASENNLKEIDVQVPLGVLTCITGVSGSGKSTLLHEIIYKGLKKKLDKSYKGKAGRQGDIKGWEQLRNVVLIDQSPIGRTPRSNPATYTGVFTPIRELYAQLPEARIRGYKPGRFSFNVHGGRCEACHGEGEVKISMLFMPDVYVKCEVCNGTRYNRETLEVKFKGKSISDVLEMTVSEALEFFKDVPRISNKLSVLEQAGMGYMRLGQPATTLSGGEAQRVKLAEELSKRFKGNTLYLLDEPTTGLHYSDVKKLLLLIHKLVDSGNTVIVIEHNLDFIASSDYIIDLGPEGGARGGNVVVAGPLRQILEDERSYTALYLRKYLKEIGMTNYEEREE